MDSDIVVALIALAGTLLGSGGGVLVSSKLTSWRTGWRSTTSTPGGCRWWRSKSRSSTTGWPIWRSIIKHKEEAA